MMESQKVCRFCSKEILRKVNLLLHEDHCEQNPSRGVKPRRPVVRLEAVTTMDSD